MSVEDKDLTGAFPLVIGQFEARRHLIRAIHSERLAQAYLFLGPSGSGKLPMALELARVLNCDKGAETSATRDCECRNCQQMRRLRHPNLLMLFPLPSTDDDKKEKVEKAQEIRRKILDALEAEPYAPLKFVGSGQILIEYVREIQWKLSLAPDLAGERVVIIQPAEGLHEVSSNTLLKLLEEPPPRCILILCAESTRELPPTIVSRCQQVRFAPLPTESIRQALVERRGLTLEHAARVAPLAGGSYTRALHFTDEQTEAMLEESIDFLRQATIGDVKKLNEIIDRWTKDETSRADLIERLEFASLWLRDALLCKAYAGADGDKVHIGGNNETVKRMASRYTVEQLENSLQEIEETGLALGSNSVPALALSSFAIKIHRILM
jgi:DNA polymerase III subunit delta'